ncbi:U3 small nucleolar RNA-associated protein NOL7 [Mixophyes fleayi]|uniref:U3 small nucleolar RNA-associated protein NOL7 n=1 Tax=Mixophyes fleayi TaxID=3061075 RepID=UPI003F4E322A
MTPEHELESEEDEAPEEVTFQSARVSADESARMKREAASRDKALLKEKRKRKIELFKDQKKKKLLSDDLLQTVSSLPDKQEQPSELHDETSKGGGDEESGVKNKRTEKLLPRKRLEKKYKVLYLKDCDTIDLQQRKAKAFIKKKLYGESIKRTTANEFLSVSRKKGSNKQPAAQFTDNTWGDEEKKKAEKFKLLWASKKKL